MDEDESDERELVHCPKCDKPLGREFRYGRQFICHNCGAVLETMPSKVEDQDEEEDTDYEFGGRLCLVPEYAVKPEVKKRIIRSKAYWKQTESGAS